ERRARRHRQLLGWTWSKPADRTWAAPHGAWAEGCQQRRAAGGRHRARFAHAALTESAANRRQAYPKRANTKSAGDRRHPLAVWTPPTQRRLGASLGARRPIGALSESSGAFPAARTPLTGSQ